MSSANRDKQREMERAAKQAVNLGVAAYAVAAYRVTSRGFWGRLKWLLLGL